MSSFFIVSCYFEVLIASVFCHSSTMVYIVTTLTANDHAVQGHHKLPAIVLLEMSSVS